MNDIDWGAIIGPAMQAAANYSAGRQVGKAGEAAAANADPFAQYRPQYANALAELQRNPASVQNTPGYRFAFDQGQQALERSAAAKGMLGSGNVLAELQKYGQGMAENQLNNERNFLAKASGAYLDPSTAARIGLQGRMDQLGTYNQAAGSLLSGGGFGGGAGGYGGYAPQSGSAGTVNSLMNLYKAGKGAYDAWGNAGSSMGTTSGASELGPEFSSWAGSQPGYYGDYGGYASNWGYGDAIDSGAMDSFQAGTNAASTGGYADAAGGALGGAGQGLGYLGAANSLANILQGKGGIMDYWKTGKTAYDAYNAYAAGQAGATGAGTAASGTAGAAGGSSGASAGGLSSGAAGGLMFGAVLLGGSLMDAESAREKQSAIEGGNRTAERLNTAGADFSTLTPDKYWKVDTPYAGKSLSDVWDQDSNRFDFERYAPQLQPNREYLQQWLNDNPAAAATTDLHDLAGNFSRNMYNSGQQLPSLTNQTNEFNLWKEKMISDRDLQLQRLARYDAGGA
jgi:hypothetical protein